LLSLTVFWKTDFTVLILQIIFLDSARTALLVKAIHQFGRSSLIFICELHFVCIPRIFSLNTLLLILRFFPFALRSFLFLFWGLHNLIILDVFYENVVVLKHTLFLFSVCNLLHSDLAVSSQLFFLLWSNKVWI
jgi:hypothetical protein